MTVQEATAVYKNYMSGKAPGLHRTRLLQAIQVLRHAKRKKYSLNPPGQNPVVIYRRVLAIYAQKQGPHRCDAECKRFNHNYVHEFKPGAVMYGLPNGDLLIRSEK